MASPLEDVLKKASTLSPQKGTVALGTVALTPDDIAAEYRAAGIPDCYSEYVAASVASNAIQANFLASSATDLASLNAKSSFASAFQENLRDLDKLEADCNAKESVLRFITLIQASAYRTLHQDDPVPDTEDSPPTVDDSSIVEQVYDVMSQLSAALHTESFAYVAGVGVAALLVLTIRRIHWKREAHALLRGTEKDTTCPQCGMAQLELKSKKKLSRSIEHEHKNYIGTKPNGKSGAMKRTDTRKVIKDRFLLTFKCANCKETFTKETLRTEVGPYLKGEWHSAEKQK